MSIQVQFRRGSTAEHSTFTGIVGEITVDTTKDTAIVHDGTQVGGYPLLREDQTNLPSSAPALGVYKLGTSLGLSTNSSGRFFIDSNGNVGIANTTPLARFHISGSAVSPCFVLPDTTNPRFSVGFGNTNVTGQGQRLDFYAGDSGSNTSNLDSSHLRMSLTATGNVGIGTTNPASVLHTSGTITLGTPTQNQQVEYAIQSRVVSDPSDVNRAAVILGTLSGVSSSDSYISFVTNKYGSTRAERVRVDATGNVGIATTNPSQRLHVVGSVKADNFLGEGTAAGATTISHATNSQDPSVIFWGKDHATNPGHTHIVANTSNASTSSGQIVFFTYNGIGFARSATFDKNGNLGIGTNAPASNPSTKLHIREDDATDYSARMVVQATDQRTVVGSYWRSGIGQYGFIQSTTDAESAGRILSLNPSGGNVGIGITGPSFAFECRGEAFFGSAANSGIRLLNTSGSNYIQSGNNNAVADLHLGNWYGIGYTVITAAGNVGIGITNPSTKLAVNGFITENPGDGTYWNIVTQKDIGYAANQVPLNQYLGRMAFVDAHYPSYAGTASGADAAITIDASEVERYAHIASFTADRTLQINNLTPKKELIIYLRNTNASARTITIQASTTTSGHGNVNLAPGAGTIGAASVSTVTLAATSGTAVIWVAHISGNIVGGLMA